MVEDSSLLSNTSTEINEVMENSNNLENSNQSFVIEIKHYKTILLGEKPVVRKKELQKLRFPQLMVAYYFDYTTKKKILYSVLSSATTKLEVPKGQMKIGFKEIKPMAKRAIVHKENKPEDMVTRRRVLLLKSQLGLQQKAIPQSINLLSTEYLKRKRKKIFTKGIRIKF